MCCGEPRLPDRGCAVSTPGAQCAERGWVSTTSATGKLLLEELPSSPPPAVAANGNGVGGGGPQQGAPAVSQSCACNGSPCLRHCVHGVPITQQEAAPPSGPWKTVLRRSHDSVGLGINIDDRCRIISYRGAQALGGACQLSGAGQLSGARAR
jgi:hypothetical protein